MMGIRWRLVLPVLGLILFGAASVGSIRLNRQLGTAPRRYYFWSCLRLDSDPMNRHPREPTPCKSGDEGCGWELQNIWVDCGYLTKSLWLTALPAFALGGAVVAGLGHLGVNQVWSFAFVMPLMLFGWFYFVGWLVDRWIGKRSRPRSFTSG
jgi:hypothetical protein